jgi:type II secretory pathway pseudopilin PulG
MQLGRQRTGGSGRVGFTLAELAVTIVIVGLALVLLLQGLSNAKLTSAQTRNFKLARELAILSVSRVQAGLFDEELESHMEGTYSEEGYPDFLWELTLGDEEFREEDDGDGRSFDSWAHQDELDLEAETDDDDEEVEEPYERVRVKVTFPKILEYSDELVLERWVPWLDVHPSEEEDEAAEESR